VEVDNAGAMKSPEELKAHVERMMMLEKFLASYDGVMFVVASPDYDNLETQATVLANSEIVATVGNDVYFQTLAHRLGAALGDMNFKLALVPIHIVSREDTLLDAVKLITGVINAEMVLETPSDLLVIVHVDADKITPEVFQDRFTRLATKHKPRYRIKLRYIPYTEQLNSNKLIIAKH